jgi:hypothetical protein
VSCGVRSASGLPPEKPIAGELIVSYWPHTWLAGSKQPHSSRALGQLWMTIGMSAMIASI